ncbi:HD domain-containing protein [Candidatus Saccharibacteria bacterium]|nr:HD domain-containing protein [Candidatus Saccharibacteria bacterium]
MIAGEEVEQPRPKFNLGSAIELAKKLHSVQMSKSGLSPYIEHPLRVMEALEPYGEDIQMVGVLHDTLEDTKLTEEQLRQLGCSEQVIEAVLALTETEGESYDDRIRRAKTNHMAKIVKLADNLDNANEFRLARLKPDHADYARSKYKSARALLFEDDPRLEDQAPLLEQRIAVLYQRDKGI